MEFMDEVTQGGNRWRLIFFRFFVIGTIPSALAFFMGNKTQPTDHWQQKQPTQLLHHHLGAWFFLSSLFTGGLAVILLGPGGFSFLSLIIFYSVFFIWVFTFSADVLTGTKGSSIIASPSVSRWVDLSWSVGQKIKYLGMGLGHSSHCIELR
ncbi:hypothetical protein V8F06_001353 [Rhypophila decipiens]